MIIEITIPDLSAEQVARFTELAGEAPGCSFASRNWEYLFAVPGAPHLICDTHHHPANSAVYEQDPGEEHGLCRVQYEQLAELETALAYRAVERGNR